jgi:predicted transcriptional regulator YdeE
VLTEYAKCEPSGIVEVYADCDVDEGEDFTLYVGIVMEEPMPAHFKGRFDTLSFEAHTWLVFTAVDNTVYDGVYTALPNGRKQMHKNISEWLSTSEYEQNAPQIVSFLSYDMYKPDIKSEIWVPVRKRKQ